MADFENNSDGGRKRSRSINSGDVNEVVYTWYWLAR